MNTRIHSNIATRIGVIQLWTIPHEVTDDSNLRDQWLIRGDSWDFQFYITIDGNPLNVGSDTFTLEINIPAPIDPTIIATLAPIGDPLEGVVGVTIKPVDSSVAGAGSYTALVKQNGDVIDGFTVFVTEDLIR